ncbi:MAG: ABC transporter permease [Limisphaerales bacterium]
MKALLNDYGMVVVLFVIAGVLSVLTWTEQQPAGKSGARRLVGEIKAKVESGSILIATGAHQEDLDYSAELETGLEAAGYSVVKVVNGDARAARGVLKELAAAGTKIDLVAGTPVTVKLLVFEDLDEDFPELGDPQVVAPSSYMWPTFLKVQNLLNISNQVAVISILAIGMTLVIITAGIDLSVGSLIALSSVIAAWFIENKAGGLDASAKGMIWSCLAAIVACGLVGLFTGTMVTVFMVPPFIVTLAMMLVTSGFAYIIAGGTSIYKVPDSFTWLGVETFAGIPIQVILMFGLYVGAHLLMSKSSYGRKIYAVGGNPEAARLSGVRVNRVLVSVYVVCGLLAGVGGVVLASQLKSGSPTYGNMFELYTIAAVVVGGTSLMGGEGKIFGTLTGAFVIGVINNGMNLRGVDPYTQRVVLGFVILAAVILDKLKKNNWRLGTN